MIVKHLSDIEDTEAHVRGAGFESRRLLLAGDGLGYSLHDTVVEENTEQRLHYKNHIETNYCIAGEGEVENLETGEVFSLKAGSLYTLDRNEAHVIRAGKGGLRFVCIFTPALTGRELHDADGSYGLPQG
ncbi:ectoine synthase [Rhodobacteraceae bacterium LMO-12]|nr:ectoine synthase [Rhodobacteraceae bacterium LMO-JJ12]